MRKLICYSLVTMVEHRRPHVTICVFASNLNKLEHENYRFFLISVVTPDKKENRQANDKSRKWNLKRRKTICNTQHNMHIIWFILSISYAIRVCNSSACYWIGIRLSNVHVHVYELQTFKYMIILLNSTNLGLYHIPIFNVLYVYIQRSVYITLTVDIKCRYQDSKINL